MNISGLSGDLIRAQPAEEAQLHDPAFARVAFGEAGQRVVEGDEIYIALNL